MLYLSRISPKLSSCLPTPTLQRMTQFKLPHRKIAIRFDVWAARMHRQASDTASPDIPENRDGVGNALASATPTFGCVTFVPDLHLAYTQSVYTLFVSISKDSLANNPHNPYQKTNTGSHFQESYYFPQPALYTNYIAVADQWYLL